MVVSVRMLVGLDDARQIVAAVRVWFEVQFAGAHMLDPMHPLLDATDVLHET